MAAWFFGANAAGQPTYDPATGVTFDGVAADGTSNHNSGAESTIHGLLTMLALDAAPRRRSGSRGPPHVQDVGATLTVAGRGRHARRRRRRGEADVDVDRRVAVRRHRLRLARPTAGTATFDLGDAPARPGHAGGRPAARQLARSPRSAPATAAGPGRVRRDRRPGRLAAPGALLPVTLPGTSRPARPADGHDRDRRRRPAPARRRDASQPLVSRLVLGGDGHGTALLRSAGHVHTRTTVTVPGTGDGAASGRTTARGRLARHVDQRRRRRTRDRRRRRRHPSIRR